MSAALVLAASPARADEPTQRADALFDAGKRLLDAGAIADACRAFADSYALDPTGGTLLNLGICLEKQGKIASAVDVLERALARANDDARADRAKVAQNHLEAVRPRLSFLVLERGGALGKGPLLVEIDGKSWPEEAWQTPRALDPGEHEVRYGEPGAPKRSATVAILSEGSTQTLSLLPAPTKPKAVVLKAPAKPAEDGSPADWLLPTGIAASVLGGIGLAVGTGFGVEALNIDAEVTSRCPEVACNDQSVVDLNDEFDRAATASTASFVAGGVMSAIGVGALIAAATLDRPEKNGSTVAVKLGAGFISLEGRW